MQSAVDHEDQVCIGTGEHQIHESQHRRRTDPDSLFFSECVQLGEGFQETQCHEVQAGRSRDFWIPLFD